MPVAGNPHALAAAARRRLDQHWVAEPFGVGLRILEFGNSCPFATRQHRHARALHDSARTRLVAHQPYMTRAWPHEIYSRPPAGLREVAVLREEPITRMHRVGPVSQYRADNRRYVEVAVLSRRRPDTHRFVGHAHVKRVPVSSRVNRNRVDSQFTARPDYPD